MDAASIERIYSSVAGIYDWIFGHWFSEPRSKALGLLDLQSGGHVLEVGVGTGLSLKHYPRHYRVIGIDCSEQMLAQGKRRLRRHGLRHVSLMKMDAMQMTFEDNMFDAVFAAYVISAVPDPHQVMREMIRVCKVGGKIVLINHFQNGNLLISKCEKAVSPLTKKIGFQADLDLRALLDGKPITVEKKEDAKPFNYWKVVQCIKRETVPRGLPNGTHEIATDSL